jgi:Fic family protein
LPPQPPIDVAAISGLLSRADIAIGRLDGVGRTLPDPDLFVAMYVRREAVYSSQIEGTQSTLDDVLAFELEGHGQRIPLDVEEVVNHVAAMNHGLQRLGELPLSLRLIREIHEALMQDVRGAERSPGEFRRSQNWIGPAGGTLAAAAFVPPPVHEMMEALGDLEIFLHEDASYPPLIHAGLAHAQFETIHPFLDGNGRMGRLLITFLLVHRRVIQRPLLYLSLYLRHHRAEYYDRLMAVRLDGDWEGWLRFFLRGVAETAEEATGTAEAILRLRDAHREMVRDLGTSALHMLDVLYERPVVNVAAAQQAMAVSWPTANKLIRSFQGRGLLEEMTGQRRNRVFRYAPYLALFKDATIAADDDEPVIQTRGEA